jgi:hypothetical protein
MLKWSIVAALAPASCAAAPASVKPAARSPMGNESGANTDPAVQDVSTPTATAGGGTTQK